MHYTRREFNKLLLSSAMIMAGCGGGDSQEPTNLIAEQCDYNDGATIHRYFRGPGNKIYYAWSDSRDGLSFTRHKYPVIEDAAFPVLVTANQSGQNKLYLVVQHHTTKEYKMYDVTTDKISPKDPKVILKGGYFNTAFAVVDQRWYALIEGKAGETFYLMQSYSDWPDLNFNTNLSGNVINDAGNPTMIVSGSMIDYFYGADYRATGIWRIRAGSMMPGGSPVRHENFVLSKPGIHLADPGIMLGAETTECLLSIGYSQTEVKTLRYSGSYKDLFNAITEGRFELDDLEDLGVTMRWQDVPVQ